MWFGSSKSKAALAEEAERVRRLLADAGVRAVVDSRRTRPGVRFGAADRCGAALRIEVRGWAGPGTLRQYGSTASCTVMHQASWPSARPGTMLIFATWPTSSFLPPTDWRARRCCPHLHLGAPPCL